MSSGRLGTRVALVLIVAFVVSVASPPPTTATHNRWRTWDAQQWSIYNYSPCYQYHETFSSSWKSRISEGRVKWNNTGTELYIRQASGCAKWIRIHYYDLHFPFHNAWAFVQNDLIGGISYSDVSFNSCRNLSNGACAPWYTGLSNTPSGHIDLATLAVHEWGHVVELSHSEVCDSACSVMYPWQNLGQMRRNLNTHDYQSIRGFYPYPAK